MAKHGPEDNLDNASPEGGYAGTNPSFKEAQRAFEKALRYAHEGDLNKESRRDTGASTTPA